MWFFNVYILGCTQKQPQLHMFYDDGTTKGSQACQHLIQVQGSLVDSETKDTSLNKCELSAERRIHFICQLVTKPFLFLLH